MPAIPAPAQSSSSVSQVPGQIIIQLNDTLSYIWIREFGKYDSKMLLRLRELNPWLDNADEMEAGKPIEVRPSRD